MVGTFLVRGMLVGVIAALLAFGFARLFGEPPIDRAIAFEEQIAEAAGEPPEAALVSRATQAGLGLFTGLVVYGAAIGGLFSLVFAFVCGRAGNLGVRATAALIAAGGFLVVVLVPAIKYPPNPPSIGNPETIAFRTELFFLMIALSLLSMLAAIAVFRQLVARHGAWNAALVGCGAFVLLVTAAEVALPSINEVPEKFSAVVLWQFRVAALGLQARPVDDARPPLRGVDRAKLAGAGRSAGIAASAR